MRRGGLATATIVSLLFLGAPAAAEKLVVRVATFDVEPGASLAPQPAPPPPPTFRHTFGSERRMPEQHLALRADTTGLAADVVLLQGITDVQAVRRLFPAASWTVLMSRQVANWQASTQRLPTTGIAVRHSTDFRASRQEHFVPPADLAAPAATAVLLRSRDRQLWLLSVDYRRCRATPCVTDGDQLARLPAWLGERLAAGDAVAIGGPRADVAFGELHAKLPGTRPAGDARTSAPKAHGAVSAMVGSGPVLLTSADQAAACGPSANGALIALLGDGNGVRAAPGGWILPLLTNDSAGGCILAVDLALTTEPAR